MVVPLNNAYVLGLLPDLERHLASLEESLRLSEERLPAVEQPLRLAAARYEQARNEVQRVRRARDDASRTTTARWFRRTRRWVFCSGVPMSCWRPSVMPKATKRSGKFAVAAPP